MKNKKNATWETLKWLLAVILVSGLSTAAAILAEEGIEIAVTKLLKLDMED